MPTHFAAWQATLTRHGLSLSKARFYQLGGWSTRRLAELLITEAGSTFGVEDLALEKEAEFQGRLQHVQIIQPVVDIAARHRDLLPMAVATSGMRKIVTPILEELGLIHWFATVVTAEDVVDPKPAPDLFFEAARRLQIEPRYCRVYEDTDAGIEAAQRAGMPYVDVRPLYPNGP
jgi:beta-phosphoglucomutase-like phosphatase (HAD superfamily)